MKLFYMGANNGIFFLKFLLAGCTIGFGGMVFLTVENKTIGSLLFSFGLLSIITKQYNLYTGQVAFLKPQKKDIVEKILMLVLNMIGIGVMGVITKVAMGFDTSSLCSLKMSRPLPTVFLLAVFCGVLMYLAVSNYNSTHNVLYVVMSIMMFVLCGFEHCIANVFYFVINGVFNTEILLFFIVSVLGNTLGSILWFQTDKYITNKVSK